MANIMGKLNGKCMRWYRKNLQSFLILYTSLMSEQNGILGIDPYVSSD